MDKNQQTLTVVILALVVVIGFLVYDRPRHETLGDKLGSTIDRAADDLHDAVDRKH